MDWTRVFTGNRPPRRTALVIIAAISTLLSFLLLSSLAPDSPALGQSPAAISGTVSVQGGKPARDVSIAVVRISDDVEAETVARGLEVPWALAFTPDGRILVTERRGQIRVIQDGQLLEKPLAVLDVAHVSEAGLMGIAVDPRFRANRHLYVCYTYVGSGGRLFNRVARLTESGGVAGEQRVVLDGMPGGRNHNGCRLRFGPDGKLYVTMGDAGQRENAQAMGSLSGKVLRINADGSIPSDNPFPGSPVYTFGHRNPQGLDWSPITGDLVITEHGPSRDDEINILSPGGNYGWPLVLGQVNDSRYVDPILTFTPTLAVAGGAFYTRGNLAASWEGNFLFSNLKASHLHRVVFAPPDFDSVLSHESLFQNRFGRLRAAAMGPDGYFYFTTSNRDGRGDPMAGDDRLMRLIPATGEPAEVYHPAPSGALDAMGSFELPLRPGSHKIRWSLPGYLSVARRVEVSPDQRQGASTNNALEEITLWAGDLNGDGIINEADLNMIEEGFGGAGTGLAAEDLNGDGVVDVADLALLGSNWGRGG